MGKESINREHKDRLFSFIFGREENKEWALELYNAINGTAYEDAGEIEITTISDVVYMGMKNDVSFILRDTMNLYEQQSSFNPNMPLRELMYAGKLYDKYIRQNRKNIYGSRRIDLPAPKCVVFYNGLEAREDCILRLSDAFHGGRRDGDIEVVVRMININKGHNAVLMANCKPLSEYAWFVHEVRENVGKGMEIKAAAGAAIDAMPKDDLIYPFLEANRSEVIDMCLTEYDEDEVMEMFREEGREEGLLLSVRNVMSSLKVSALEAMDILKLSAADRQSIMGLL